MAALLTGVFFMVATFEPAAGEIAPQRFDELKIDCDTCHGVRGVSVCA